MTEAAKALGEALPVEAVAGPALPPHLALAQALREALDADGQVDRTRRKVAKTRERVAGAVESAEDLHAQALAEAEAADARVRELAGGDAGAAAIAALKQAAADAQATYERAAELLGGGE
jgi:hypothetical protein